MASIAEFTSLEEQDRSLLGRHHPSSHILREDGKSNSQRIFGAGGESVKASGSVGEAHNSGWGFERNVANAYDIAFHENRARLYGWTSFTEAAPVPAAIDTKWSYETCKWPREIGRIQEGASDTGNGYERPSKHAFTPEFLPNRPPDWDKWRTPHRLQHPSWQPGEEADFLPLDTPVDIPCPRLTIGNSPPSTSRSPGIRTYNTYQASTPPELYRSIPNQYSLDQDLNCGKSLETMEVEAAFILMLIRHETPEAAAMAISRELRLAQEERQFRREGSPCGSEDTIVGSEIDDEER
ncbi:hypothetical protein NU195Hw_g9418t1 [Hortaea werneckii]